MGPHVRRAQLLLEQERWEMAEEELRLAVAEEPEPAFPRALLALCLARRERWDEAAGEARAAIAADPELAFAHYAHGTLLRDRRRYDEALEAAGEALRLEPENAAFHALQSSVHLEERRWGEALRAAEAGLACDAEDVNCNNLRAAALVHLGRRAEAGVTLEGALARDPENATTHANRGWGLLHEGEPKKALEHFREALRLEPGNEWARAGIVEALKARNPLYGFMLRYFLFMGRLSDRAQWMILIGGYVGQRMLRSAAKSNPALAPWVLPILVAYAAFAVLTWISVPLFNLFLRLHPVGKHALSPEQKRASNWVGACLFLALSCLGTWLATGSRAFEFATFLFGLTLLPLCGVFGCPEGWPRRLMAGITALLFVVGGAALVLAATGGRRELIASLQTWFFLGALVSQFVAAGLSQAVPRR